MRDTVSRNVPDGHPEHTFSGAAAARAALTASQKVASVSLKLARPDALRKRPFGHDSQLVESMLLDWPGRHFVQEAKKPPLC